MLPQVLKGCYDTCSDCYCYLGLCDNPAYERRLQCCNRSCGKCTP
uniref:ShKT domain-containing protein n=1 Tax=Syphacia muris TaxID=451379 RepID=A0A0N5AHF5_9BILA